ncbi:hypothetical protein H6P81_002967 [Aristolochia fimbriata]|uniref:Uncharacterized protein n=1 Tax=Aristolochia fimbriata TaxID=158543 RepID=A0AAV7FBT9_ARIFI|nr:hypothetical protein H6P81_002967 [Aristolochia fimbriata]
MALTSLSCLEPVSNEEASYISPLEEGSTPEVRASTPVREASTPECKVVQPQEFIKKREKINNSESNCHRERVMGEVKTTTRQFEDPISEMGPEPRGQVPSTYIMPIRSVLVKCLKKLNCGYLRGLEAVEQALIELVILPLKKPELFTGMLLYKLKMVFVVADCLAWGSESGQQAAAAAALDLTFFCGCSYLFKNDDSASLNDGLRSPLSNRRSSALFQLYEQGFFRIETYILYLRI